MNQTLRDRYFTLGILALYTILVIVVSVHHEPWADEAQAWLMARDSGFVELISQHLRYEGSPGLWHVLLMLSAKMTPSYKMLNAVSVTAAIAGMYLFLNHSPFPKWIKILFPFSFYIFYQYAVVARSYSLMPLLIFALAMAYPSRHEKKTRYTVLLCLLSHINLHGALIALGIYSLFVYEQWKIQNQNVKALIFENILSLVIFSASMLFIFWMLIPPEDISFGNQLNFSLFRYFIVLVVMLCDAFATNLWPGLSTDWVAVIKNGITVLLSVYLIAFSLKYFKSKQKIRYFIFPTVLLYLLYAVVHINAWHLGVVFLLWVFVFWISLESSGPNEDKMIDSVEKTSMLLFAVVLTVQGIWSYETAKFDLFEKYSSGYEAAQFIKEHEIEKDGIYGTAYYNVSVLPYFEENIYKNHNPNLDYAFWVWSKNVNSMVVDESPVIENANYLLIADRNNQNKDGSRYSINDYELEAYNWIATFKGGLFWKEGITETDNLYLYKVKSRDSSNHVVQRK